MTVAGVFKRCKSRKQRFIRKESGGKDEDRYRDQYVGNYDRPCWGNIHGGYFSIAEDKSCSSFGENYKPGTSSNPYIQVRYTVHVTLELGHLDSVHYLLKGA
jgi:hypothetical protein